MKTLALGLSLVLLATGASITNAGAQEKSHPMTAPNTLTKAEKAAGWKLLFDGRDLDGWRGFKAAAPDAGWHVTDGVLSPDPKTSKDVISKDTFGSFDLTFEWKIAKRGNSGVMYHVIEQGEETYQSGPEYQILDNARGEPPLERAGSLFALYAPSKDVPRPVGEFNQSRLLVDHGHVQHWLNGVKVVEYDLGSADFKARVAASKFKAWPQFAASPTGHIALQNHGDEVFFKTIKIRPLD